MCNFFVELSKTRLTAFLGTMPAEKKDAAEEKPEKKDIEAKKDEPKKVPFLTLEIKI
jgi:hypothetical protein